MDYSILYDRSRQASAGARWIECQSTRQLEALPRFYYSNGGPGYVYLLRAQNGLTKIGATVNLPLRIARHRRKWQGDFSFEMLGVLFSDDCYALESRLHLVYEAKRIANKHISYRGDWFNLSLEDVAYIKSLGGAA